MPRKASGALSNHIASSQEWFPSNTGWLGLAGLRGVWHRTEESDHYHWSSSLREPRPQPQKSKMCHHVWDDPRHVSHRNAETPNRGERCDCDWRTVWWEENSGDLLAESGIYLRPLAVIWTLKCKNSSTWGMILWRSRKATTGEEFHFVGTFCSFVVLPNAKEGNDTVLCRIACFYFDAYYHFPRHSCWRWHYLSIFIGLHHWFSSFALLLVLIMFCWVYF